LEVIFKRRKECGANELLLSRLINYDYIRKKKRRYTWGTNSGMLQQVHPIQHHC